MALRINRTSYYHTTVQDRPGEAYRLLSQLSAGQVNLLAFNAVPGASHTQLVLFTDDGDAMLQAGEKLGLTMTGPHPAFLVQGDDELGALVDIHGALYDGNINVVSLTGVTSGQGNFGYIIYVRPEDFGRAAQLLNA